MGSPRESRKVQPGAQGIRAGLRCSHLGRSAEQQGGPGRSAVSSHKSQSTTAGVDNAKSNTGRRPAMVRSR